jgi:hypothetical protein
MSWLSLHVFYTGSLTPLLVECVEPLVRRLREQDLISRYFFIRYWLEGPHVRLRLLPAPDADPDEVTRLAEAEIAAYLRRRPALYEPHYPGVEDAYRELGMAEYGERWWTDRFGPDGVMDYRPTNSVHRIAYEPEYDRYGGPAGVELAEWHFEHSSDLVLRLSGTANVHVRPVLLGMAAQLSLAMSLAFLDTPESVALFLGRYRAFWQASYARPGDTEAGYEKGYDRIAEELAGRVAAVRAAVAQHRANPAAPWDDRTSPLEGDWIRHCHELRERVGALADAGGIVLRGKDDGRPVRPDRETVPMLLLSSYLHMTNNRLSVSITDEIYLSYLLERALTAPAIAC